MNALLRRIARAADSPPLTDGQLLDAFVSQQREEAFAALVQRHGPMVLALCRRILRHHDDAEDAFQATFLVLARRAADVWPQEAVGAWLNGVAYRVALKSRGRRAQQRMREQPLDATPIADAREQVEPDLLEAIDRAVQKLPAVYRAAIVACDLQGLCRKEAAERLGWKEGTLSGRLARARELLAVRLRKVGLALPAGGIAAALGRADAVSAGLVAATVRTAFGPVVGLRSAEIAALSEGVVRSMSFTKLTVAAAIVFAAGAVGFGAWSSVAGAGRVVAVETPLFPPIAAAIEVQPPKPDAVATRPRLHLALQELDVMQEELDTLAARGKLDETTKDRLKARSEAIRSLLAPGKELLKTPSNTPGMVGELKRLQGRWRLTSQFANGQRIAKNAKTDDPRLLDYEIRGNTLLIPQLDEEKNTLQHVSLTIWRVDPSKSPKEIDLIEPNFLVSRGAYALGTANGRTTLTLAFGPDSRPTSIDVLPEGGNAFTFEQLPPNPPAADVPAKNAPERAERERLRAEAEVTAARAEYQEAREELSKARDRQELAVVLTKRAEDRAIQSGTKLKEAEEKLKRLLMK